MSNISERCFVYSREQMDNKIKIETASGRPKPKFGNVIVRGVPKIYTEIVTSLDRSRFADATLVIRGDIRDIKFTEPEN